MAINLNNATVSFDIDAFSVVPRVEYRLTAPEGNMSSQGILLNGVLLEASAQGQLPSLQGQVVTAGDSVDMEPTSYAMFEFPSAAASACM